MKLIMAVLVASCALARGTTFDIGPAGTSYNRSFGFGQFNGVTMIGQTLSCDLNFTNSIHLFKHTDSGFMLYMTLQTNGTDNTGFASGSGFVLDAFGQQMCGVRPLAGGRADDGRIFLELFPLFADDTGLLALDITRPLDFYGAHIELTLPDTGLTITGGSLNLFAQDFTQNGNRTQPFRVGPHVPDNGSTILLFAVGIVALWLGRFDNTTKQAVEKGN